jgi:hypothetical protein
MMVINAKCGHVTEKSYAEAHHGLCRRCHSNFSFILELEQKYGEDALIEYWYSNLLTHSSETKEAVDCLINHLIKYYQRKLTEYPSKKNYIEEMLYMLRSIQEPFDIQTLR